MSQTRTPHKVPTLEELHKADPETAYGQDQIHLLCSQPPAQKWVKKHPIINVKVDGKFQKLEYIPEHICRFLLRKIFGRFKEHVLREGAMFNSVYAVVRVEYFNPNTEEWEFVDGIGAVGAQTDQGEAAGDLSKIKQDAIMKGLPAAASYAFKNACKKLGRIFGGDLNKSSIEEYTPTYVEAPVAYPTAPPEPGKIVADTFTAAEVAAANKVLKTVVDANNEPPLFEVPDFAADFNLQPAEPSAVPSTANQEIQF
jgi:hypothetical protein